MASWFKPDQLTGSIGQLANKLQTFAETVIQEDYPPTHDNEEDVDGRQSGGGSSDSLQQLLQENESMKQQVTDHRHSGMSPLLH